MEDVECADISKPTKGSYTFKFNRTLHFTG